MIGFENEQKVQQASEGAAKSAMLTVIEAAHTSILKVSFDAIADCGGDFPLLEPGDDLAVFHDREKVNRTALRSRNQELLVSGASRGRRNLRPSPPKQ
ncbi:hypothetical protein [Geomonas agri]|uniref:hypothetical protein n=1 Tax=Geomonas agri TaxID=2873702 RepID=UPI001CD1F81C|nr:hypothetical protein [Geomonas agri]